MSEEYYRRKFERVQSWARSTMKGGYDGQYGGEVQTINIVKLPDYEDIQVEIDVDLLVSELQSIYSDYVVVVPLSDSNNPERFVIPDDVALIKQFIGKLYLKPRGIEALYFPRPAPAPAQTAIPPNLKSELQAVCESLQKIISNLN